MFRIRQTYLLLLLSCLLIASCLSAQVEKILVEKYYVSDSRDASDTTGGYLAAGSVTYRIYIDLAKGSKLLGMYGNSEHAFKISSDSVFFNHKAEGQSFAKDMMKVRLGEGTVALDSWLTLGQCTKNAAKTYIGVPKVQDTDGSFIGGSNNDGGSSSISGGLITHVDSSTRPAVTIADGYCVSPYHYSGWYDNGILDRVTGADSTIFGSLKRGKAFSSNSLYIVSDSVRGFVPDSNQILVAQITTRGKLSFQLNVKIADKSGNVFNCVAVNGSDSLAADVVLTPSLKYPPDPLICGCLDPNYLEYRASYGCPDSTACKTAVVLGCMDPMACNYDPKANVSGPNLCCYPGYCQDRDLSIVCPALGIDEKKKTPQFELYPLPAREFIEIEMQEYSSKEMFYQIYDLYGRLLFERKMEPGANKQSRIDVSFLSSGLYTLRISSAEGYSSGKKFIIE
jgi:hypothetical protein